MAFESDQIFGNLNFGNAPGAEIKVPANTEFNRYMEEQRRSKLDQEGQAFVTKAQFSPEQKAQMEQFKRQSEGQDLMSYQIAQKAKSDTERQMKALAYARGFNPMAARGAEMQTAAAQSNIAAQAQVSAAQEKAQALQNYSQMAQYQQQMQFAGEQAKKNYLLGNQELVQQQEASMQNYQAAMQELRARQEIARQQRESQLYGALISGAAGVGATVVTGNPMAGMAAASATGALWQGTR